MTTTNTTATLSLVSCPEEMMANYFSRISAEKAEGMKKEIFAKSQSELESLVKALNKNFSVSTFNSALGDSVSEELFNDSDNLRRHLKDEAISTINKIRSFVKNGNKQALSILDWMEGLAVEQASDIVRIIEDRR